MPRSQALCLGTHYSRGSASHLIGEAEPRKQTRSQAEPGNEKTCSKPLPACAALCGGSDYSNSLLTDSLKWMRLIASASSGATVSTLMFGRCLCGGKGMLSV